MQHLFEEFKILTPNKIIGGAATSKTDHASTKVDDCTDTKTTEWSDDREGAAWELMEECTYYDCPN